jgi:hypothetical protein
VEDDFLGKRGRWCCRLATFRKQAEVLTSQSGGELMMGVFCISRTGYGVGLGWRGCSGLVVKDFVDEAKKEEEPVQK